MVSRSTAARSPSTKPANASLEGAEAAVVVAAASVAGAGAAAIAEAVVAAGAAVVAVVVIAATAVVAAIVSPRSIRGRVMMSRERVSEGVDPGWLALLDF
jgi:hypothetical protein